MPTDIRGSHSAESVQSPADTGLAEQAFPPYDSLTVKLKRLQELAVASAWQVVVLVTGILMAFALDAWWDNQRDIRREAEILHALSQEFGDLRIELDRQAGLREHLLHTNASTLSRLQQAGLGTSVSIPDTIAQFLVISLTLDLPQSSLQSVISSGRIDLIRDRDLRSMLAGWPALVSDAQEELAQDRLVVYDRLLPALTDDLSRLIATPYDSINMRARHGNGRSFRVTVGPQTVNTLASRVRLAHLAANDADRLTVQLGRIQERIAMSLR